MDETLEKFLYQEVHARSLLKFGHFRLNGAYCARDWIDTREIIETKKILNKIVEVMVKSINSKCQGDYTIIGIDLEGALLASRIAFSLQKPMTYIVPEKDVENNSNYDINVDTEKFSKVILITDSIVTYETIDKAIKKYKLEKKVEAIYTIFYRPNDYAEMNNIEYVTRTFSANNLFNIELFERSKCVYRNRKCIALNQKLNAE